MAVFVADVDALDLIPDTKSVNVQGSFQLLFGNLLLEITHVFMAPSKPLPTRVTVNTYEPNSLTVVPSGDPAKRFVLNAFPVNVRVNRAGI